MRIPLVTLGLLSVIEPQSALAYKVRVYTFVEQAVGADVIVVTDEILGQDVSLRITVKENLVGNAKGTIVASVRFPFHGRIPEKIDGNRLLFLSREDGELSLIGHGLQAIWPQATTDGACPYAEFQPDLDLLTRLAGKARLCVSTPTSTDCEDFVLQSLESEDPFVRLVSSEICLYLRDKGGEGTRALVDAGAALALKAIGPTESRLMYTSLELASDAPPSTIFPALLALADEDGSPAAMRSAVVLKLSSVAQRHGFQGFRQSANVSEEQSSAKVRLQELRAWYTVANEGLLKKDYEFIKSHLESRQMPARVAGHIWLNAAAGSDFEYDPLSPEQLRSAAIIRVETWWSGRK